MLSLPLQTIWRESRNRRNGIRYGRGKGEDEEVKGRAGAEGHGERSRNVQYTPEHLASWPRWSTQGGTVLPRMNPGDYF